MSASIIHVEWRQTAILIVISVDAEIADIIILYLELDVDIIYINILINK